MFDNLPYPSDNRRYQTAILLLLALLNAPLDGRNAIGLAYLANGGLTDDYTMRNGEVWWNWANLQHKTVEVWPG